MTSEPCEWIDTCEWSDATASHACERSALSADLAIARAALTTLRRVLNEKVNAAREQIEDLERECYERSLEQQGNIDAFIEANERIAKVESDALDAMSERDAQRQRADRLRSRVSALEALVTSLRRHIEHLEEVSK